METANMTKPRHSHYRYLAGFTLVELMIVIMIATILLTVAIPGYKTSIRKSRRTDAKTALLDIASREERYFNTANPPGYSATPTDLGYTSFTPVGSGYYNVTVAVTPAAPPSTPAQFTITAVPVPGSDQAKDAQCTQFQLDNLGRQTSLPNVTGCWQ
jgi:type IV pilus assembly protein PilE